MTQHAIPKLLRKQKHEERKRKRKHLFEINPLNDSYISSKKSEHRIDFEFAYRKGCNWNKHMVQSKKLFKYYREQDRKIKYDLF